MLATCLSLISSLFFFSILSVCQRKLGSSIFLPMSRRICKCYMLVDSVCNALFKDVTILRTAARSPQEKPERGIGRHEWAYFLKRPLPRIGDRNIFSKNVFAFFFQTDRCNGHMHNDLKGVCFKKDIFSHTLYWKGAGAWWDSTFFLSSDIILYVYHTLEKIFAQTFVKYKSRRTF